MIQIEIEIPHLSQFMCLNLPPTTDTEALAENEVTAEVGVDTEIAVGTEAPADTFLYP